MDQPEVSILCITYNQAAYVRDALDGFFMQETTFPFEVIVHDDASNDGTVKILQEYEEAHPNLRVIYEEENQYSTVAGRSYFHELLLPYVRGRYVALCEGDDYWNDPHKLQRQYDYMEAHPECLCCGHACLIIDADTGSKREIMGYGADCDITPEMAIIGMRMQTATLFYRNGLSAQYISEWSFKKPVGDLPWAVWLAENGIVHYENKTSSVYRLSSPGSWSSEADHARLTKSAIQLLELLENIDEATEHRYHDVVRQRQVGYAVLGAVHSGFGFLKEGSPGYPVRDHLKAKDWIYIAGYRLLSKG